MTPKSTADLRHTADTRTNLPSAEDATTMSADARRAIPFYYKRNRDLDPQLVWRGKDTENDAPLEVMAPPIYVQERIRPKAIIDDLRRHSDNNPADDDAAQPQMFADFNGLPSPEARTEFYQHQANWSNRMILGDSLQVMASLAEKEGLRGQVQCIYMDPPYGINFSSNWQWSTNNRAVGGTAKDVTREPEQIKAFRDTWRDGINSYLSYLRDRLVVARELLSDSGSIFVQIGDENVHHVRALMDEIFGDYNSYAVIVFRKKGFTSPGQAVNDFILHYAKNRSSCKLRSLFGIVPGSASKPDDTNFKRIHTRYGEVINPQEDAVAKGLLSEGGRWCQFADRLISQHPSETRSGPLNVMGRVVVPGSNDQWSFDPENGIPRLEKSRRLHVSDRGRLYGIVYWEDTPRRRLHNMWTDVAPEHHPSFVVQTATKVIQRCILMTSDPGDLVLDPTCGAGTTAFVAEQWGRRWITMDTSRVALALARGRLMGARYPYYLLEDSPEGLEKRAQINRGAPPPRTFVLLWMCAKALYTVACLTSLLQPSQTTSKSTSSGNVTRKTSNRSASCSTKPAAPRSKSGKCHANLIQAGQTKLASYTPSGGSNASRASVRLTHPSPRMPITSTFTTGRTKTPARCA